MSPVPAEPARIANLLPYMYREAYIPAEECIGAGFTSEVVTLARGVDFVNDLDRSIAGLHFVEAGLRAAEDGFAAIFLNSVGDYGLRELRSAVSIPVVGAGQATFQIASGLGDRFGVLTVWPQTTHAMYRRLIADYVYEAQCVGIEHVMDANEMADVVADDGFINQVRQQQDAAIQRLVRGGEALLAKGADVIALGCSCMANAARQLEDRLGCPVVEPVSAGHKMCELLVTLKLTQARPPAPSRFAASVPEMVSGAHARGPAEELCGDSCEVLSAPLSTGLVPAP